MRLAALIEHLNYWTARDCWIQQVGTRPPCRLDAANCGQVL